MEEREGHGTRSSGQRIIAIDSKRRPGPNGHSLTPKFLWPLVGLHWSDSLVDCRGRNRATAFAICSNLVIPCERYLAWCYIVMLVYCLPLAISLDQDPCRTSA